MNKDLWAKRGSRNRSSPGGRGEHVVKGQNPCVWKTELTLVWKKARTDRKREDKGRQAVLGLKQAAAVGKEKGWAEEKQSRVTGRPSWRAGGDGLGGEERGTRGHLQLLRLGDRMHGRLLEKTAWK